MLCAPESVRVEVRVSLRGSAGAFSGGVLHRPLCVKLFRGHLPQKHICKVSSQGNAILKQNQAKMAYNSFQQNTNINVNLKQTHTPMHVFSGTYIYEHTCVQDILLPIFTYMHFQSIFTKFTYMHTQGILAT